MEDGWLGLDLMAAARSRCGVRVVRRVM